MSGETSHVYAQIGGGSGQEGREERRETREEREHEAREEQERREARERLLRTFLSASLGLIVGSDSELPACGMRTTCVRLTFTHIDTQLVENDGRILSCCLTCCRCT